MKAVWKSQFEYNKLGMKHPYPEDFWTVWWHTEPQVTAIFFTYRLFFFLYFLGTFIYAITAWFLQEDLEEGDGPKFLIYISYWSYFLDFFAAFWGFLVCTIAYARQRMNLPPEEKPSRLSVVYWYFYTATLAPTLATCGAFFIGIHPYQEEQFPLNALFIIMHIPNTLLYIMDFFLVGFPYRFCHSYMCDIYSQVYFVFAIIYEKSGGRGSKGDRAIHEWIDFDRELYKTFFWATLFPLAVHVFHIIFSLFYMMKLTVRLKYITKEV